MHEAFELVPILEKFPLQIEAITANDGNLVVGTRQGHLLMYSISTDSTGRLSVNLLRSNKNFSRKPITQVAIVPDHQILVSLSDQMLSIHDLAVFNFPLLMTLPKTKGAMAFDLDVKYLTSSTGEEVVTVRLVVAVRRRLQLYYWKGRQFHDLREELILPDSPRCLVWCQEAIAVAFKHDYWIVKLTGEQSELFPTGKSQEPLITKMYDNCIALQRDEKTIFVDSEGNAICNYTLDWPEQPFSMVYDSPYLIGTVSKAIQIQCQDPKLSIQTINLDRPKLLAHSNSKEWRQILVASVSHVWCLRPIPISQQIPQLLSEGHFKLALRLADLWQENEKSKEQMKQHIEKLHAFNLFCDEEFAESLRIFFKLNTDLLFVIGLIPGLVPEDHRSRLPYPHPVPQLSEEVNNVAIKELTNFLIEKRNQIIGQKEDESDGSSPARKSKSQMLQIVDTTLLKCYLKINDSLVMPLLRLPESRVSVEEGERVLRQAHKYSELLLLLQTKGFHSKALQLLFRHSKRSESPLFGHHHTVEYLQKLGPSQLDLIFEYGGWVIKAHPKEGLKIFIGEESSSEVEQLPRPRVMNFLKKMDKSLLIPYLEHVIEEWGDTTPLLHNELIHHYREIILSPLPQNVEEGYRKKFLEKEETKDKILKFLKFSSSYTAASILVHFPPDALFEERAILLGRLGQHRDALKVYIEALSDVDLAIEYCHTHHAPSGPESEVYLILLELLLNTSSKPFSRDAKSPDTKECANKYEDLILNLLEKYYQYFNLSETLKILPDYINVNLLRPFLNRSLRHQSVIQRRKQMSRGLSQALSDQTRTELYLQNGQSVVLSDNVFCKVCCKRFTSYSAFARLGNGDIVHFSCKEFSYKNPRMKKS